MGVAAIAFPSIDPVLFELGPLSVRWYGLAYVIGFVAAGLILRSVARRWELSLSDDDVAEIVFWAVLGLFIGARLGYVVVYGWEGLVRDPMSVVRIWEGGMSFHGGLVGMLVACAVAARRVGIGYLRLADLGAIGAPVGLALGRIANFINAELWGRVTDAPWGVVFPGAGSEPRHPSQLYEAALEGAVLLAVMLVLSRRKRAEGVILGWFMVLYAVFRFSVEFFREPDVQLGFVAGSLTMGQVLTVPVFVVGVALLVRGRLADRPRPVASSTAPPGQDT